MNPRARFSTAAALILGLASLPGIARAEIINVFLEGGQSNGDGSHVGGLGGAGLPASLQLQNNVQFYYNGLYYTGPVGLGPLKPVSNDGGTTTYFGPEITFGSAMADYYASSGQGVAILKYTVNGSDLYSHWKAGGTAGTTGDGDAYKLFQSTVAAGLAALQAANPGATLVIDGMIWMQGEQDATDPTSSAAYGANLTKFINDIRLTYGANLPFVIGRLSSSQNPAYVSTVQAAQDSVAASVPDTGIVNTESFPLNSDRLHFTVLGQEDLGYAFAGSMESLLAVPEPPVAVLAAGGAVLFGLARRRPRKVAP
ncbi:MAG TPA: sialate O-acetylesterase [Candidatus Methylacidiphilales bacterium]